MHHELHLHPLTHLQSRHTSAPSEIPLNQTPTKSHSFHLKMKRPTLMMKSPENVRYPTSCERLAAMIYIENNLDANKQTKDLKY